MSHLPLMLRSCGRATRVLVRRAARMRILLPVALLLLAGATLGGCIAYPAYPAYGYGYPPGGAYVAVGNGWGGGYHHHRWRGGW
ncbi:MAG: hypothetical protein U1E70_03625 [Acetobacteraceae bacterium]